VKNCRSPILIQTLFDDLQGLSYKECYWFIGFCKIVDVARYLLIVHIAPNDTDVEDAEEQPDDVENLEKMLQVNTAESFHKATVWVHSRELLWERDL